MKTLYVIARNHMDPSWRRCFTEHFYYEPAGGVVRPYSDIEEAQILEYMDFAERFGVKYQIEQSIVVKRFLERNPDQRERFLSLVKRGLLELAGGGEAVIDYNMTCGESWVRNHLYNIAYYKREFNHKAQYAITPDTFGLPAQLPQFLRSLGYDVLCVYDRVFQNNKPFWRGLDGTIIALSRPFEQETDRHCADCVKILPCTKCKGEGCEVCGGSGIDRTYNMTRPDRGEHPLDFYGSKTAEEMLAEFAAGDKEEYFILISTEEVLVGEHLFAPLLEAAPKYGFEVKFLRYEENFERTFPGSLKALREGRVAEEDIDPRVEGNPMATGCYTSRIEIKKQNKQLEELLCAAERFAAIAWLRGGWRTDAVPRRDYPGAKLEYLWNKMAFIQFHDCITASHTDASAKELARICREVRLGACQIYRDAVAELTRDASLPVMEGYTPVLAFNPDTTETSSARLVMMGEKDMTAVEICDTEGNGYLPFDAEVIKVECGSCVEATIHAAVPPLGYRIFFFKAIKAFKPIDTVERDTIENEFYCITAQGAHITGIYDKKAGRFAALEGACELSISEDIGHPWGRTIEEAKHVALCASEISCEVTEEYQRFILRGGYASAERNIDAFTWRQSITLRQGEAMVRIQNELDWKGKNTHVYFNLPLPFDAQGKLICEIPFGCIERGAIEPSRKLGIEDEWPSLGYVGAFGEDYNTVIFKEGLPGSRIRENVLQISLMRSVDYRAEYDFAVEGAVDCGKHISNLAIVSGCGDFTALNCAALAGAFNAAALSFTVQPGRGEEMPSKRCYLPAFAELPKNVRISALKRSEDGQDLILRVWEAAGKEAVIAMPEDITLIPCNSLEEVEGQGRSSWRLRPYQLATFRVQGNIEKL